MVTTLRFGHSETMWPKPWHLKHLGALKLDSLAALGGGLLEDLGY